jgi:hypothetical protein
LSFGAYVPEFHLERNRASERKGNKRYHFMDRLGYSELRKKRTLNDLCVNQKRIISEQDDDKSGKYQRGKNRTYAESA